MWEDKIKKDLKGIGCDNMNWTSLEGSCEHSNEPSDSIKGRDCLDKPSDY
jgi:hypothetical protein